MKKLLIVAVAFVCASALVIHAQDQDTTTKKSKKAMTAEQQTVMTEMLAKYDTDKNGKLDKTERAAMTKEDKAAMAKVGLGGHKKAPSTDDSSMSTNAPAADATK